MNTSRDDPEVAEALALLGAVDAAAESIYPFSSRADPDRPAFLAEALCADAGRFPL